MADTPETVLLGFLSKKFDANTKWDLKNKRLHRLVGSFIYLRAKALIARQGKSAADAATEIANEILAVKNVVVDRLGANNRSGALGGAQDAATPGHLDLADVAKQRTTDLGSPGAVRAKQIQKIQKEYVLDRRRCVLAIIWRAAALEVDLWEDSTPAHNLKPLDVIGLKDILDRRLRAVERLHTQVGATNGRTTLESVAAAGSGWLDGMRVRPFEYPNFTLAANQRPTVQPDIPSKWVTAGTPPPTDPVTVGYAVIPPPAIRHYDGTTETQTVKTRLAWRFPASQQSSWLVSAGKNRGYRIDLVPAAGTTGAGLVDSLFSFQGTANGAPEKADVWNRAWLFCDHVISAVHLESVLFGLRRLAIATNQPLASADAAFNALVALRPQLTVHKFDADNNPLRETGFVTSPFVSLDAHLHDHGVVLESYQPDPKVLMRSQEPAGTPFADPYFRNLIGGANDLQIGDRVAVFSSQVYDSIANGVWGLENSLVMDIDPDVDNPVNRGGLKMNEMLLEGHGLARAKYPDFRTSLGNGLTDEIAALKSIIFTTQKRPVHPHNESFFVEWAPYDAFKFINVNFNDPDNPNEDIQPVQTGPWWVALSVKLFILTVNEDPDTVTPEQALAQVPGAIGRPDVVRYGLNGDPTIGNDNARKALGLGPFSLFDKYILFPLVEPRVKSQKKKATAGAPPSTGLTWSDLFFFHSLPGGQPLANITFRMLVADQKVVPGFALTRDPLDQLDHVPMVQPRPRRV